MANCIFASQIGQNMEIYVDDMLVKSKTREEHIKNLRETFNRIRESRLKVNREKCSFGVVFGKFLAVSSALVRETEGVQRPIYYVSHVLHGAEERYSVIDKVALALVVSARKLKAYIESHPIQVVTDQQLKRVMTSPTLFGRLTTWAVELSEFEISYIPRTCIKAQVLADFVAECIAKSQPNI
ncbi:hypothetical protein LIER_25402 [Lithospermum erythrorhizon]|uniref:Reverse transcriptase domain-containing protein n=1 Tax=Lithospermum erythrorhizon TaxID=34254 RepID=A0AAV3R7Y8_LITER